MKVFGCDDVVMMLSLVGFVGLGPDDESQRRRLWETFASNRGPDRHPLTFHPIDLETAELPVAKPARQTYEWLVPRGILKRNWVGLLIKIEASFTLVPSDEEAPECAAQRGGGLCRH